MTPLASVVATAAAIFLVADGLIRLAALAEARSDYLTRVIPAVEALVGAALLAVML